MKTEKYLEIFDQCYDHIRENDCQEDAFMEKMQRYSDGKENLNLQQMIAFSYVEAFRNAKELFKDCFDKIINSEEFKEDFFEEMIKQSKEYQKRTGKNPFEL